MEKFDVCLGGKTVGKVCAEKVGLYYEFQCKCKLPDDKIYKLYLLCGNDYINLGVCIPDGRDYSVATRVPIKQISGSAFSFELSSSDPRQKNLYRICQDTPFEKIALLPFSRLYVTGNEYYAQTEEILTSDDPLPECQKLEK